MRNGEFSGSGVHCRAMENIRAFADALRANVERVIVGKRSVIELLLAALLV
jgi:MoxR-like ATPase